MTPLAGAGVTKSSAALALPVYSSAMPLRAVTAAVRKHWKHGLAGGSTNTIDLRGVTVTGALIIDSSWGNDTVYGSDAAETILGGWGDDMLNGGGGGDNNGGDDKEYFIFKNY